MDGADRLYRSHGFYRAYWRYGPHGLDRAYGMDGSHGLDRLDGSCGNGLQYGRDGIYW